MPVTQCPDGMNPADPAALQEMRRKAGLLEEELPQNAVSAEDLEPEKITGLRPFSAGVLAILDRIQSPFLTGTEETFTDILLILFLLSPENNPAEFVQLAFREPEKLKEAAVAWGFTLEADDLAERTQQMKNMLAGMSEVFRLYAPEDGDGKKK